MGTDIDLVVEKQILPGRWKRVTVHWPCPWGGCSGCSGSWFRNIWVPAGKHVGYATRNYALFAQLADVRNEDGYHPIAGPRGQPAESGASVVPRAEWGHSHHSLRQLQNYDLEQTATVSGIISRQAFLEWDGKGCPGSYMKELYGSLVGSPDEARVNPAIEYVSVSWTVTYREAGGAFWSHFVPALEKLGGPNDVRIVFGFSG